MNRSPLELPFASKFSHSHDQGEKGNTIRSMQDAIFARFNSIRNAGRIERYYIKALSRVTVASIYVIAIIVFYVVYSLYIYSNSEAYYNYNMKVLSDLMVTARKQIYDGVDDMFLEPRIFSHLCSQFLKYPALASMNISGATNLTQIFYKAYISANSSNIDLYCLGINTGELICIQSINDFFGVELIYANTSKEKNYANPISAWRTDSNARNSSYPYTGGNMMEKAYDATTRIWYRMAANFGTYGWSNIFMGNENMALPAITATEPIIKNDEVEGVIGLILKINELQLLLKKRQMTPNSRIAITQEDGTLIAITGTEGPIDLYKKDIVTKRLSQINDPVWKTITKAEKFINYENFTQGFTVDGKLRTYVVSQNRLYVGPQTVWRIYSLLCATDFSEANAKVSVTYPIIMLLVGSLLIAILFILVFTFKHRITSERIKILMTLYEYNTRHIKPTGLNYAITMIQKMTIAHSNNQELTYELRNMINSLQTTPGFDFFDTHDIYSSIQNDEVRNMLISQYGCDKIHVTRPPARKFSARRNERPASVISSTGSSFISVSSMDESIFSQWNSIIDLKPNQVLLDIQLLVVHYASINPFFDELALQEMIKSSVRKIPNQLLHLVHDSMKFLNIILKWRIASVLVNTDIIVAVFLSVIGWHICMNNRNNPKKPLVERYFLKEKNEYRCLMKTLLLALYDAQIEINNERWTNFVRVVFSIVEISPLNKQHESLLSIAMFSKTIEKDSHLGYQESLLIAELLFISSTVSFLFHEPEINRNSRKAINQDLDVNEDEINQFLSCVFNEHINPISDVLDDICDAKFVRRLYTK